MAYIVQDIDKATINRVLSNPTIYTDTFGHTGSGKIELNQSARYFGAIVEEQVVSILEITEISKVCADVHIAILPEFRKKYSETIAKAYIEYLQKYSDYMSLIAVYPKDCAHVGRYLKRIGFTEVGNVPNGIVYNNRLQQLYITTFSLR